VLYTTQYILLILSGRNNNHNKQIITSKQHCCGLGTTWRTAGIDNKGALAHLAGRQQRLRKTKNKCNASFTILMPLLFLYDYYNCIFELHELTPEVSDNKNQNDDSP